MNVFNLGKGFKSILGCVGAFATYLMVIVNTLSDGFQMKDIETLIAATSALLLAWGLTGKAIAIENSLKK